MKKISYDELSKFMSEKQTLSHKKKYEECMRFLLNHISNTQEELSLILNYSKFFWLNHDEAYDREDEIETAKSEIKSKVSLKMKQELNNLFNLVELEINKNYKDSDLRRDVAHYFKQSNSFRNRANR